MEILHSIEEPILIIHQSVYRITGASRMGQLKGDLERWGFRLQSQDFLADHIGQFYFGILCPFGEAAQALGKLLTIHTVIDLPQFCRHRLIQPTLTAKRVVGYPTRYAENRGLR